MSERRIDPYTGRAVWIVPSRRGLGAAKPGGLPEPAGPCPFCPGQEADTEPTIARWPDAGPWRVRVVRNKYPLVGADHGDHEVGVDAPEHDADLGDLAPDHVAAMLRLYRGRVRALSDRPGVRAVVLFRNRGRRAGSSQPHPHSQIVAVSDVPAEIAHRWARAADAAASGAPLHVDELARELGGPRLLHADDHAASFCPFASTRPYQVRIAPRAPTGGFVTATDPELASAARQLVDAVARLRARVSIDEHNLILRTPPVGATGAAATWALDLLPRTGGDAGYELATGERIVVVPPEDAAHRLR